jgi:hypothetical protein
MLNYQPFPFGLAPDSVELLIAEGDEPGSDFGLHVWPSGRVLAYSVWDLRSKIPFDALRVLELGCGVSISVRSEEPITYASIGVMRSCAFRACWLRSWVQPWC